jgi:hypothetical protein
MLDKNYFKKINSLKILVLMICLIGLISLIIFICMIFHMQKFENKYRKLEEDFPITEAYEEKFFSKDRQIEFLRQIVYNLYKNSKINNYNLDGITKPLKNLHTWFVINISVIIITIIAIEAIKTVFYYPNFDENKFERLKKIIEKNLKEDTTDPFVQGDESTGNLHNGYSSKEILENIDNVTLQDVENLHKEIISNSMGTATITLPNETFQKSKEQIFNSLTQIQRKSTVAQNFFMSHISDKNPSNREFKKEFFLHLYDTGHFSSSINEISLLTLQVELAPYVMRQSFCLFLFFQQIYKTESLYRYGLKKLL